MRRIAAHFAHGSDPHTQMIGSIGEAAATLLGVISVVVVRWPGTARGPRHTIVFEKSKDR